jgi:hypothetical protein
MRDLSQKIGKIKMYGHLVPASKEAAEMGIGGFCCRFYCSECDKTYQILIVEIHVTSDL